MPLPRERFTVRRMMVAVAIVGALIAGASWCAKMARLSRGYAVKADFFESAARPRTPPGHGPRGMGSDEAKNG
jgi:flavin-dependent dehydrogenase